MENACLPNEAEWIDPRDLAAAWIAQGRSAEAISYFEDLLGRGRGGILARIALAQVQRAIGETALAVATMRDASSLAPEVAEVAVAFAEALAADANLTAAIAEYQRAARLAPDDPGPQLGIALLWVEVGEWDKAHPHLEAARALEADGTQIALIENAIARAKADPRLPAAFVRHLFDQFSADYDQRMLDRLGYAAPAILRDLAAMMWGPKPPKQIMLDLGCGTGLAARAFKDCTKRIAGIDLSPKMLAQAQATGLYADLIAADIEEWLGRAAPEQFDVAVAADVFVYLGDLSAIFAGTHKVLKSGGSFLFTVERGEASSFQLGTRRRYQHSEAYIRDLATAHDFFIASLITATLRHDAGVPVEGFAALMTKS